MVRAAIGLGSNVGDRVGLLRLGLAGIGRLGTVLAVSSLYETGPVGGPEQDPYLNAVALVDTSLAAADLLAGLQQIEVQAGRVRQERWGPRTLDLDLVVYDGLTVDDPDLELPHPRAHQRRFVLEPLVEVWPDAALRSGSAREALDRVGEQDVVLLAAEWGHGVPRFLNRGGGWVVGQALALAGWALVFATTAELPPRGWEWVGLLPLSLGAWMLLSAVPMLGRGLTPFPVPSRFGKLTTTGPYAWVRHPMYGGIFLALAGASVLGGSWPAAGASLAVGVLFYQKAGFEERFLRIAYSGYGAYTQAVRKRLLPGII